MTWSYARVDAHQNGDCDTATCPLCELERADEEVRCDQCGESTSDPECCPHGREHCPECAETNRCKDCVREARP